MKSDEQLIDEIKNFFDQIEHLSDKWDDSASEEFKHAVMANTEKTALEYTEALSVLSRGFSQYVSAAEQLLNLGSGMKLINWILQPLTSLRMLIHVGLNRMITGRDYHFRMK